MERKYFLTSDRVGFSKWTYEDRDLAYELWGNPLVTKLISGSGIFTEEQIEDRLKFEIENGENHNIQYWPIFELETDKFMGVCGLRPKAENTLELGCHLVPEFWDKGYATECSKAVINYAFNELNVAKIFAGHNPNNHASAAIVEKLGFTYIGDEFYTPTGLNHPSYEMTNPNLSKIN